MQSKRDTDLFGKKIISLSLFTVAVKLLGFLKQAVVAAVFGAAAQTDIFFIASGFFADMSAVLFTPVALATLSEYSRIRALRGFSHANGFFVWCLKLFAAAAAVSMLLCVAFADFLARSLGFGLSGAMSKQLALWLRVMAVGIMAYCVCALLNSVLQANGSFLPSQGRGIIRSICIIAFSLWLGAAMGARALALGLIVALFLETVFMAVSSKKFLRQKADIAFPKKELSAVLKNSSWLALSFAAAELSHIIDKSVATHLTAGAVSALCYAQTLQSFGTAIFATNVGAVAFAGLSKFQADKDEKKFLQSLYYSSRRLLLFMLPVCTAAALLSRDIVSIAYLRGSFSVNAHSATSAALFWYMAGLPALSIQTLLLRGCYAKKAVGLSLLAGFASLLLNAGLSMALSKRFGVGAIAAASAVSYCVGALIAAGVLKRKADVKFFLRIFAAWVVCLCAGSFSLFVIKGLFMRVIMVPFIVLVTYLAIMLAFREKEIAFFIKSIKTYIDTKHL